MESKPTELKVISPEKFGRFVTLMLSPGVLHEEWIVIEQANKAVDAIEESEEALRKHIFGE